MEELLCRMLLVPTPKALRIVLNIAGTVTCEAFSPAFWIALLPWQPCNGLQQSLQCSRLDSSQLHMPRSRCRLSSQLT
eukprot:4843566-Amphidinium_carterae.1